MLLSTIKPPLQYDLIAPLEATVHQFWEENHAYGYKRWKMVARCLNNQQVQAHLALEEELMSRKIRYLDKQDILCWGHSPKGKFTT